MAIFKHTGIAELEKQISNLRLNATNIETVLRAGGLEVLNAVKSRVESLPTRENNSRNRTSIKGSGKATGITPEEKQGILHDLGTAKMQYKNGYYDIKVGVYKGYFGKATKKYPNGKPTQMVLRSLEKGTSWLNKQPVIAPALKRSKDKAVDEMQRALEKIVK